MSERSDMRGGGPCLNVQTCRGLREPQCPKIMDALTLIGFRAATSHLRRLGAACLPCSEAAAPEWITLIR
jgi:hypothetical protein